MKVITIAAAAKRLNIDERDVKNMCKNGSLEIGEIPGELPGVTEESICEFLGEDYEEKEPVPAQKKRGRQPSVLSHEEAAEILDSNTDNIAQLAFDGILEEWELPDSKDTGVTKRSVDTFIKVSAMKESDGSVEEQEQADIAAKKVCNEAQIPTVPEDVDEEPLVLFTDFSGMPDAEQEEAIKEVVEEECMPLKVRETLVQDLRTLTKEIESMSNDYIHSVANTIVAQEAAKKKSIATIPIPEEPTVTMLKRDFHAHLSVASMRAELMVYRSMKSFERR